MTAPAERAAISDNCTKAGTGAHRIVEGAQLRQRHVTPDAYVAEEADTGILAQQRELVLHILHALVFHSMRNSNLTSPIIF